MFTFLVDKKRLMELGIYGLASGLLALIAKAVGNAYQWWEFPLFKSPPETIMLTVVYLSIYTTQVILLIQYINGIIWLYPLIATGLSLPNTAGEAVLLKVGIARYTNGWNLWWTFADYVLFFTLALLVSLPYKRFFTSYNQLVIKDKAK